MANNKIQIKRSVANSTVTGLANGELAFTQASNTLWIGLPDGTSTAAIGGVRYPGTLTANQALVANSTSGIDKVITANLVPQKIYANGGFGTTNYVLVSGGTGSNVYWESASAVGGVNTFAQYTYSNTITFNGDVLANNIYSSATVNAVTVNAATLSVGGWVVANAGGVYVSGGVNASVITVGSNFIANTSQVTIGTGVGLSVNGSLGTANQVLRTSGTSVYWSDDLGDISSVTAGSGLSGGGTVGDLTIDVGQGNGIIVGTDTVYVNANNGLVSNISGVFVKAGTGVTVNATGVHIGQSVGTTDNVTFANVVTQDLTINGNTVIGDSGSDRITFNSLVTGNIWPSSNNSFDIGSNTLRWNNIYANSLSITTSSSFGGNVSIDGNLTVTGNVTTTNVDTIIVSDPMIYLAGNNYSSDLLDIGFAANYYDGAERHTGLFRDHTDGLWKLFYNLTQELSGNNDVDTGDASYRTATLVAFLNSGGLTTNTSAVTIAANSTVAVNITANTLTLSSPLSGTSGGTGLSSIANNSLIFGNSTNGFNTLALGTSGYVLQSNGSAIVYDVLDGGTF